MAADRTDILSENLDERQLQLIADLVHSIEEKDYVPEDPDAFDIISAEEQVFHYVRAGDLEALLRMRVPGESVPIAGTSRMLHLKCLLVALNALCLHAALDGGVSAKIGYGLNMKLAERIMTCASEDELAELMQSQFIPLGYCLLVRELSLPSVSDKDIVKAIRYIHDHHHERVSARELASHVGLSPEYLSAKFKRETGLTVSSYISQMRIQEAKALLRFTDLSIGEIAAQLSFSSQSYFQTSFKRESGMTPQQYRASIGWEEGQ